MLPQPENPVPRKIIMKLNYKPKESPKKLALIGIATFVALTVALFGAVKMFGGNAHPAGAHQKPAAVTSMAHKPAG